MKVLEKFASDIENSIIEFNTNNIDIKCQNIQLICFPTLLDIESCVYKNSLGPKQE